MYWKRFLHDFGVANFGFVMPEVSGMKMSEAVKLGEELQYAETRFSYRGCLLGTAYRAKTGELLSHALVRDHDGVIAKMLARFPDVPERVIREAENRHVSGVRRIEIAEWLAKQGY